MVQGKVLIVDDVALNVTTLCELVSEIDGLEPVGFEDPEAALLWCKQESPILILCDFEMPKLDGAQFVTKLRATEDGAIVPVVVITAHTDRKILFRALEAGANDFLKKPFDEIEVLARVRTLSQLGFASRRIAALASTDELTGLASRRRFLAQLRTEIERARRYETTLALVMFDVDHFKQINDSGGHEAGDEALREISRRALDHARESDFIGRLGGEEFGWALPSTGIDNAISAAERLRRTLELIPFEGNRCITASFGVAALDPADDAASLLRRADRYLYEAKAEGRNRVASAAGPTTSGDSDRTTRVGAIRIAGG